MIRTIALVALYDMVLRLSQIDYVCRPYTPSEDCEQSRYEFTVKDITERGAPEIAHGTAQCVTRAGRFIQPHDGTFSIRRLNPMAEPFDKLTLPAKQTTVCRFD